MTTKKAQSLGTGCLALFGLPFAAVGTFMLYLTVSTALKSVDMQSWPTRPATLKSLELKSGTGKSKTRSVAAEYSYEVDGKTYSGNRVSLYSPDNIGSFHDDLYAELAQQRSNGASIQVHVNPADPVQSIIRTDLRWGILAFYMVFAATFGIVGWGLIVAAILASRSDKKRNQLQALHPTEPWLWEEQWKNRKIRSMQKSRAVVLTLAALFWNAISLPATLAIPREVEKKNYGILALLIFTVIGVALLYVAVVAVMRSRRFGKAWFELQTLPARPGASLRGVLHPAKRLEGVKKMKVKLECQETIRTSRSGIRTHVNSHRHRRRHHSKSSTRTETVWQTELEIPPSRIATAMDESPVQIDIPLPAYARTSQVLDGDRSAISWKLSVHAELAGPDFSADFEVPVFGEKIEIAETDG